MDVFLLSFEQLYRGLNRIGGTALFFARDALTAPPYMVHTMFKNNIIYEDNIIVSIVRRPDPYGDRPALQGTARRRGCASSKSSAATWSGSTSRRSCRRRASSRR